jgi:VanZ family protein
MNFRDTIERVAGSTWLRWLAASCLVAIAFLSLAPKTLEGVGESLPHGSIQHFVGYSVTAALFGLAARRRHNPIGMIVALMAFAALMEVLQSWSPGRHPEIEGFVASSLGAAVGAIAAYASRTG